MKKAKKSLVLLSTVVFGLAMASCGGENGSSTSTNVVIPSTNVATPNDSVGLEFKLSDDNDSYYVSGLGTCTDTDVVIPASYRELPVTSIGVGAFFHCFSLTSITIPSSVTSIGGSVFKGCWSLRSITIPSSVTHIGSYSFKDCSDLTSINYTGTMEQWWNIYDPWLQIPSGVVVACTDGTITIINTKG